MKTLEQIKNDYAVEQCFLNWDDLIESHFFDGLSAINDLISHENEVMKIYAMECLKLASENVTTVHHKLQTIENVIKAIHLTKHSITNENNIIK